MNFVRSSKYPASFVILVLFWLFAFVNAGLRAETNALPAQDWNLQSLNRIKVPKSNKLTFAVLGDNRSNPVVFNQVLKHMDRDPELTFAIAVGDLVETGTINNFKKFLDQVRQYPRLPFLTVIGNHDLEKNYGPRLYHRIFGPDYYSFQIKDHYFIALNNAQKTGIGQDQWRWLESELKNSQTFKTRLVFLHIPLFDLSYFKRPYGMSKETGGKLLELFRRYHVTHVFAGHLHAYLPGDWDGVPYTITGGAGAPLYGSDPQHFFHHYLKVTLIGDKVNIEVQRIAEKGSRLIHE